MPLFEIVGAISTKMTYSVAFAFLSFEQETNFTWALGMLVGLLTSKLDMPKVVVTDRDTALMNVVAKVLPKTNHVLCYFHIEKNVKAKAVEKYVKEANDEKHYDLVKKIVRVWR
jgi:transposase-like protein